MKKQTIYLPLAVLAVALSACSTPKQDVAGLSAEIDAGYKGHFGQAARHEEHAAKETKIAEHVLKHWQDDQYWNIDEKQKAMDAAKAAAQHRVESEKELCMWLAEQDARHTHVSRDKQNIETSFQHTTAYFNTGSAVPHKHDDQALYQIGHYLETHPEATANVSASTDTVGSAKSNQKLSERRAQAVKDMLVHHGAKPTQISTNALGMAPGPAHVASQEHRVAEVTVNMTHHHEHFHHLDCSHIK